MLERLLGLGDPFTVSCSGSPLTIEDADFQFEMIDVAATVLDGRWDGVLADGHASARGVEQADRLVRELPGRDITV